MRFLQIILCCMLLASAALAKQAPGADYVLTIDGVDYDIAIGKTTSITLKSGAVVPVRLKRREFGRFNVGDLAFEYPGQFNVASTAVDDKTNQHVVATALGTIMLVQHYADGVPSGILDVMFEKMVEEPKALNIPVQRTELNRQISNNMVLKGTRAYYKGGDDEVTIDITTTSTAKGGYLVLTMHDAYTSPEELPMIERFWKSLELSAPPLP
jgi:hypothetical protein